MAEAIERPPRRHERLLSAVLGRFALASESQTQAEDTRREGGIQLFESSDIAFASGGDDPDIVEVIPSTLQSVLRANCPQCAPRRINRTYPLETSSGHKV